MQEHTRKHRTRDLGLSDIEGEEKAISAEDYEKVPQAVGQLENFPIFMIPWGHNVLIIERVQSTEACFSTSS